MNSKCTKCKSRAFQNRLQKSKSTSKGFSNDCFTSAHFWKRISSNKLVLLLYQLNIKIRTLERQAGGTVAYLKRHDVEWITFYFHIIRRIFILYEIKINFSIIITSDTIENKTISKIENIFCRRNYYFIRFPKN